MLFQFAAQQEEFVAVDEQQDIGEQGGDEQVAVAVFAAYQGDFAQLREVDVDDQFHEHVAPVGVEGDGADVGDAEHVILRERVGDVCTDLREGDSEQGVCRPRTEAAEPRAAVFVFVQDVCWRRRWCTLAVWFGERGF